jgi:D-beta-D-heptose 7-phosphate kinase/D-beta-D-heptose 1-phosphate adenosyltransferase
MDLAKLKNLKILVIGDVMLDHYIIGKVSRISPEAPVQVVNVSEDLYVPGGAGNVAFNISGLGPKTALIGQIGADESGERLQRLFQEKAIELIPLEDTEDVQTIVKSRVTTERQQICRIDREQEADNYHLSKETIDFICKCIGEYDAVIISDYSKGLVDDQLIQHLIGSAKTIAKKPLMVIDPKPRRKLNIANFDLMTPNLIEAKELAGIHESDTSEGLASLCETIYEKYQPKYLVITLGSEGMCLCQEGRIIGIIETEAQEVFDVSGAGDTVVSTLTVALSLGYSFEESARLANKAAGIVVSRMGTSHISASELFKA